MSRSLGRLAQQASLLFTRHQQIILHPEMQRALHVQALGTSSRSQTGAFFTHTRPWGSSGFLPQGGSAHFHHQQREQQQHAVLQQQQCFNSALPVAPLLAHRRPWRQGVSTARPPAAAASFTASTPPHGPAAIDDDGPEGELHAVETAIRANALIFAAKLAVFFISNSSAMLAEAVHSVVDIANQLLLRIGIMKAQRQPNEVHPYGYARDQFIWPLISAVGIFCCGAGVSFVHGITGLFEAHREIGDLYWNFVVLGVSGVLESHSLYVAVDTLRRRATQQGMSLLSYIKTGADPAAVAVMMEDGAAVAGLFIAGGCLALCQSTGAVYWDSVGSIAVSALLGVVAVTLIQRNRKWLIGKSMPKAQEDQILEHLLNDHVIRHVSNIKSEELGVRQYRFQADIAFDGEELARRALDRCGRVRLFKALDAAIRRHDPHALDALLMQFAAVIVSTTGAEVDRMEREIMRLVPGTRWVDLETDRGKPARLSSAYAAAAAAMQKAATEGGGEQEQQQQQPNAQLQQQQQQKTQQQGGGMQRPIGPMDSISDQDYLADLSEYPWGSLGSFSSWDDVHENVPEWIRTFGSNSPEPGELGSRDGGGISNSSGGGGTYQQRLRGADSSIVGGNYLSHEQMHAIEAVLVDDGGDEPYKPFCNSMLQQLQDSGAASRSSSASWQPLQPPLSPAAATSVVSVRSSSGSGSVGSQNDGLSLSWELKQPLAADAATQQQLADWEASTAQGSWPRRRRINFGGQQQQQQQRQRQQPLQQQAPTSAAAAAQAAAAAAQQQQQQGVRPDAPAFDTHLQQQQQQQLLDDLEPEWGQEHKRRAMQKLLELEDNVIARDGDTQESTSFCDSMIQKLHPDNPKKRPSPAAAAAARQQAQAQQQQQQRQQQQSDTEELEPEPKQHLG